jgi:hypothetical protein
MRTFNRREVLRAAVLGAGGLVSCDRALLGEGVPERLVLADGVEVEEGLHLLSRAGFGPWPGDMERVKKIGREAWLEEQLHPERINDTACDLRAERFESVYFSAGEAYEFRKPVLRDEITRHTLLRAIYSRRQLFEVMVEFWTDHLNIDLEKGDCIYLKPSDDREVIRKHALGNFYELIRRRVRRCWCIWMGSRTRCGGALRTSPMKTMRGSCWSCTRWGCMGVTRRRMCWRRRAV